MIMTHQQKLYEIKMGWREKECKPKEKKPIAKQSAKKKAEIAEQKVVLGEDETIKEKWFKNRRGEMSGTCGCGCGEPSSKNDPNHFRSSICHIFPQRLFPSIQFHPVNWVERKFWATTGTSACHSQMDNKSMDLWVNMADWEDIKEKFKILSQWMTNEERSTKFYTHLEKLVHGN
jgi:hypothetical protein